MDDGCGDNAGGEVDGTMDVVPNTTLIAMSSAAFWAASNQIWDSHHYTLLIQKFLRLMFSQKLFSG